MRAVCWVRSNITAKCCVRHHAPGGRLLLRHVRVDVGECPTEARQRYERHELAMVPGAGAVLDPSVGLLLQPLFTSMGACPRPREWCDLLRPYLKDATAFVCPATKNQRCSYAFNANLSGVRLADIPKSRRVVILFESDRGWNAAGGPELLPAQPRHSLERDVALRGVRQTLAASGWSRDRLVETDHWLPQARAAKASR